MTQTTQSVSPLGVELPRATLANWMIQAGTLIQSVINLLRDRLLRYNILQMDETTAQVLLANNSVGNREIRDCVQKQALASPGIINT